MSSLSDCDSPLGIESGDIPNSDMTASSEVSKCTVNALACYAMSFVPKVIICICSGTHNMDLAMLGLTVQLVGAWLELGPPSQVT